MSAKKIIIPIVIAAVVAYGVGYYCYTTVNVTSQGANTTVSSTTSSAVESTGVNVSASKTTSTVNNTVAQGEASKVNSTSNSNAASSTVKTSGDSASIKASSDTTNNTTSEKTNSGTITYTVPSSQYTSSAVVVENTTGNPISESQLDGYLRSWIMVGQYNCQSICDATGTYWEKPWLNKVSQETLYQAFLDANGEAALSKNITANEFIKATQELNRLTANDVPFTISQAKTLILNMLQEDGYATPSEVTKIVFVQGQQGYSGYYEVYTKESGNNVFWTVYANTGYAHG